MWQKDDGLVVRVVAVMPRRLGGAPPPFLPPLQPEPGFPATTLVTKDELA